MYRFWHNKKRVVIWLCLCVIAVVIGYMTLRSPNFTLEKMGVLLPPQKFISLSQGKPWTSQQTNDSSGFAQVSENSQFILLIHPRTSQIIIREKSTGFEWRSNPTEESLKKEKVQNFFLTNIQSPFVMEYFTDGRTQKLKTDALQPNISTIMVKTDKGIQVTYSLSDINIQLTIQYELTEKGLTVILPSQGIVEKGANHVTSIDLLPFFGASQANAEGYLFVPDGPGGLIRFNENRTTIGNGYYEEIYGAEIANLANQGNQHGGERENIRYPVFGLKDHDHAFLAIVEQGKYTAAIRAMPAGIISSYNSINSNFMYRQTYGQRLSKLGKPVETIQKDRVQADAVVQYRFLSGHEADYVGMANEYRNYLLDSGQLDKQMKTVAHVPLDLSIIGGDSRAAFGGTQYIPVTTFSQAEEMVKQLVDRGVKNMSITYKGWEQNGSNAASKSFSLDQKLGGRKAASSFVQKMHGYGFKVLFNHNLGDEDGKYADISPRTGGIRSIDSTVLMFDNRYFILNPILQLQYSHQLVASLKDLGVDGVLYENLGDFLFRDYNPNQPFSREKTEYVYHSILSFTRQELGLTAIYKGSDYALKDTDYIAVLSAESNYDYTVDETVPFYPIVIHGFIPYSTSVGNLRSDYEDEFLRAVEYGALPSFLLSNDPPRELKGTSSDNIVSSDFVTWEERVVKEYKQFDQMADLLNKKIVDHKSISAGVFVTTYEDGTQIIVDYNSKTYQLIRG